MYCVSRLDQLVRQVKEIDISSIQPSILQEFKTYLDMYGILWHIYWEKDEICDKIKCHLYCNRPLKYINRLIHYVGLVLYLFSKVIHNRKQSVEIGTQQV